MFLFALGDVYVADAHLMMTSSQMFLEFGTTGRQGLVFAAGLDDLVEYCQSHVMENTR